MAVSEYINIAGSILVPLFLGMGIHTYFIKRFFNKKADELKPAEELMRLIADKMLNIQNHFPEKAIKALDIEFKADEGKPPIRVVAPLVLDQWIEVGMGVSIMGISSTNERTVYHLKVANSWGLKTHRHAETESVKVLSGMMIDRKTGKIFTEGDTWSLEKEEWHSVTFTAPSSHEPCIVQITIRPPLKDVDEDNPLDLKHAAQLVGLAT